MGEVSLTISQAKSSYQKYLTTADEAGNNNKVIDTMGEAKAAVDYFIQSNEGALAANSDIQVQYKEFLSLLEKSGASGIQASYEYIPSAIKLLSSEDDHSKQAGIEMLYERSKSDAETVPAFAIKLVGNNIGNLMADYPDEPDMISKFLANMAKTKNKASVFGVLETSLSAVNPKAQENALNTIFALSTSIDLIPSSTVGSLIKNIGVLITSLNNNVVNGDEKTKPNLIYSESSGTLVDLIKKLVLLNKDNQTIAFTELENNINGADAVSKEASLYVISLISEKDAQIIPETIFNLLIKNVNSENSTVSFCSAKALANIAVQADLNVTKESFKNIKDITADQSNNIFKALINSGIITVENEGDAKGAITSGFRSSRDEKLASFALELNKLQIELSENQNTQVLSILDAASENEKKQTLAIEAFKGCLNNADLKKPSTEEIKAIGCYAFDEISKTNPEIIPDDIISGIIDNLANGQKIGPPNKEVLTSDCVIETLVNLKERAVNPLKAASSSSNETIRTKASIIIDKFDTEFSINQYETTAMMLNFCSAAWHDGWKDKGLKEEYMSWALKHMDQDTVIKQLEIRLSIKDQRDMAIVTAVLFVNNLDKAGIAKVALSDKIMKVLLENLENTDKIFDKQVNMYAADILSIIGSAYVSNIGEFLPISKGREVNALACYILYNIAETNPDEVKSYFNKNSDKMKLLVYYADGNLSKKINGKLGSEWAADILEKIK